MRPSLKHPAPVPRPTVSHVLVDRERVRTQPVKPQVELDVTDRPQRTGKHMPTILNKRSYAFAEGKIKNGTVVRDQRDDWSEHQPSAGQENEFIEAHGWDEYANWHLGVDDEATERTKARYKFPYGDFARVHRCGLLAAEVRAGRTKYRDIEQAAIRLRDMVDEQGR